AAVMAVLGELGRLRRNFMQGAAGTCNRASQSLYEHPWGAKANGFAKLLLPRLIRDFFKMNGVAELHNLMDESAMQALSMGRKSAILLGEAASCYQIPATVLPVELLFFVRLDTPVLIIIGWIVGAT